MAFALDQFQGVRMPSVSVRMPSVSVRMPSVSVRMPSVSVRMPSAFDVLILEIQKVLRAPTPTPTEGGTGRAPLASLGRRRSPLDTSAGLAFASSRWNRRAAPPNSKPSCRPKPKRPNASGSGGPHARRSARPHAMRFLRGNTHCPFGISKRKRGWNLRPGPLPP